MGQQERPLVAYAALSAGFAVAFGSFVAARRAGDGLPDRISPADVVLVGVATHKASRLIAKDRIAAFVRAPFAEPRAESPVPGEVEDRARGAGLRRAVGQLLTCPHCLSVWLAAGFAGGLVVAPRETRLLTTVLGAVTVSDFLQAGYRGAALRPRPSPGSSPSVGSLTTSVESTSSASP
jgi:hypothetical protein